MATVEADAEFDYWRTVARGHDPPLTLVEFVEQQRLAWMRCAACGGVSSTAFFPARGASAAAARALCAGCPVRAECLDYALAAPDLGGIWGGTSERQRRALRAAR